MRLTNKDIDKQILNLILLYFISVFFYGIIIKITFGNSILFQIKTYIPELILGGICFLCILKKKRFSLYGFIVIIYFTFIFALNVFTSYSTNSFLMTFRDVYIPIVTCLLLASIEMKDDSINQFLNKLCVISYIALLIGFVLGLFQYINGWEWTSSWYTGYSFWGTDTASSMYIMTSDSHVRVPSITGHNVKFAMASFFQALIIFYGTKDNDNRKKRFIYITTIVFAITNIYISNNKTTLVIVFVIFSIWLIKNAPRYTKIIIGVTIITIILYTYYQLTYSTDFMLSFYDRFSKWSQIFQQNVSINLLVPISTFNFAGNGQASIAALNYWDNTYLYFAFAYGIIGLVLLIIWIYKLNKKAKELCEKNSIQGIVQYLTIFTLLASLTTSIVLGRCFFSIYLITIAFLSNKRGIK
ncbi:hypothetical protein NE683_03495 [Bariatricus massiliensis]|uniref:O-antigen polymerase n=1 Tax=Bariatricus massiliensis TaxID=1745713 RepID=A0ABS8DCX7_9FIRM|nr:hypothetical protein [Bariatricus massiliensis]MCB7303464.1 hypothetical protein [Bariatricus massiliensis]MCB7373596.1 hypothetical protein [Bariatricus massiliensis]MCB7386266.1 hypothetical protein [Bariatricus massiliensis]MCB7410428.1 hypothetical protein [Bariatricus massiliensis]MCQ5252288.1 hypothetical protein [Bariatricus massiliensis]